MKLIDANFPRDIEIIQRYYIGFCLDEQRESKTTYTFENDGCIILVRNVPCIECEMCGEIFFKGDVSQKLDEIIDNAKIIPQELAIIDYNKVA